jgi:hypothetical protein
MLRDYIGPDRRPANFMLDIMRRSVMGLSITAPLNCLPGAGWILSEPAKADTSLANGSSFTANKHYSKW